MVKPLSLVGAVLIVLSVFLTLGSPPQQAVSVPISGAPQLNPE